MRLDHIFKSRLKSSFRQPLSLFFIILAIVISVASALLSQEKLQSGLTVAIVVEDSGDYGQELLSYLAKNDSFVMQQMSRDQAMRLLNQDRLEAAVIIRKDFSEKIQTGQFRNTLELYTSPSAQAPATISEPLINGTMMLWLEQFSLISTEQFLQQQGSSYDIADRQQQQQQIDLLWDSGSVISVENIELDHAASIQAPAEPFFVSIRWYALLCLFYLVIGAFWVMDINKKSLHIRINRTGMPQWKIIIANCLAPLLICIGGYLLAATASTLLTGGDMLNILIYFLPMLRYLIGLLGMTLVMASLLENILALMFLAPLLTFLNGVLSELFLAMPDWAYVLTWISRALPGRWLNQSLAAPIASMPGAIICCIAWLALGIAVSILRTKHSRHSAAI